MFLLLLSIVIPTVCSILQVQRNERRFYDQLDGLWTFVREEMNSPSVGITRKWHLYDLSQFENATVMPVPAAFNELTADREVRDHVGWVWYQRKFFLSVRDKPYRHFVRFSSVQYYAVVFINNRIIGIHVGGHLPFEIDITNHILFDNENRLTVAVNNTMTSKTIPPGEFRYIQIQRGEIKQYSEGFFKQTWNFDFFNYAGILRPVYITRKPFTYIDDISIEAGADGSFGYKVHVVPNTDLVTIQITVMDRNDTVIFESNQYHYTGRIDNIQPWWPRDMGAPVLYKFMVQLAMSGILIDVYRLWFGFRTVNISGHQTFINGKPFYCHGFGMHEDFELHGRGYNPVVMIKDLNMLEWMNGNCYRTSHYPYSEEMASEADRRGIAVITETPAVGLRYFTKENQLLHADIIREMIERDRNHPSTIMWSLANEPVSSDPAARPYFSELINLTRILDPTRPVTTVVAANFDTDQIADLLDLICINRYFGWYIDIGYLEIINQSWIFEVNNWKFKYNKPIIISEYGAEALPGLNQEPGRAFSEQYQRELLEQTHIAFDILRKNHTITGEMIWNLADFMTADAVIRAVGNHKGVLTRNRQPKMAAYILKNRYKNLEKTMKDLK
ncbi:beta-glucuronidase [Loa loa]|uniref:Beta-glucuronidase n=2 Tax=Loa loa TaxID=7209 RepID=A0A1S0UEG9_LOALO|nr:beta-glucuronidase [Loa loa]EJD73975.1 beta-glucuronidase [Loa loa]